MHTVPGSIRPSTCRGECQPGFCWVWAELSPKTPAPHHQPSRQTKSFGKSQGCSGCVCIQPWWGKQAVGKLKACPRTVRSVGSGGQATDPKGRQQARPVGGWAVHRGAIVEAVACLRDGRSGGKGPWSSALLFKPRPVRLSASGHEESPWLSTWRPVPW